MTESTAPWRSMTFRMSIWARCWRALTGSTVSGITPALSPNCSKLVLDMLRIAKEKGLTVSFDGNFRSMLWSWEEARDFCTQCLPYVDILLGIEPYHLWRDEEDHSQGDFKDGGADAAEL